LLRFLKLKVIVNGKIIYPVEKKKPVIVPLVNSNAIIVVTDGFHITYPFEVAISSAIEDEQLIMGFLLLVLFYSAGLSSDLLVLKVLSFVPIIIFLYLYYIKRKGFIKVWML